MKKIVFGLLAVSLILPSIIFSSPVLADSQVCGVNNVTYSSAQAAESAGVDVSYGFACVNPTSEKGLYEAKTDVNFVGALVEVGSTDVPTTIIIRDNKTKEDFTVNVATSTILGPNKDQITKLSDWVPGDQIKVSGKKNENTDTIDASRLVNVSIVKNLNLGANGWITKIDKEKKEITYTWDKKEYSFKYDASTKFVSGVKNPASVDDLKINDRIRARLVKQGDSSLAKIVVVLRRGNSLFMKIRTFKPNATLVRLDSVVVPTTIQVRIDQTPGLKGNDVNNLIGAEGTLVTVNVTADTNIVRKYFGNTTLNEFSIGDKLQIVGRVNDDGTVDAKLIKNNSIWKTSVQGYPGVVTEVNAQANYLMMNWTPVKQKTKTKLKAELGKVKAQMAIKEPVTASILEKKQLGETLMERVKEFAKEKIGQFQREIKYKKVKVERIKTNDVKLGDLIERKPAKKVKVEIASTTKIMIGANVGTINDIKNGDKIRVRGVLNAEQSVLKAETIVVVSALPEVEESLETDVDDVNQVVSEISTDDSDTTTDTEEEIIDTEEETTSTTTPETTATTTPETTATTTQE